MAVHTQLFNKDGWRIRRRVMFAALLYIAVALAWIIARGTDSALYLQIAVALIAAAVAIISSYVFGATWDDNNKRATLAAAALAAPKPEE